MLRFFNPGHEYALLNQSPYYTLPANLVRMQQELAFLSFWYSEPGDWILLEKGFDNQYKQQVENVLGLKINSLTTTNIQKHRAQIKVQKVDLWGISPQAIHTFKELNKQYNLNLVIPEWRQEYVGLSSRETSQKCLQFIINENQTISESLLPLFHPSLESVEEAVNTTPFQLLSKAPYSSSGRGLLWLPETGLTRTERQILHGIIKKQGLVSTEKALNRKLDFAMEFHVSNSQIDFLGYSLFKTNKKGAYLCNYLASQEKILSQIGNYISTDLLKDVIVSIKKFIENNISSVYTGYLGVDMLVYEEEGHYYLHPCVEINMRNNMGIVSLNLSSRYVDENSEGYFYIDFSAKDDIYEKHLEDIANKPICFANKKIKSGYFPLCPVCKTNKYRAYMIID